MPLTIKPPRHPSTSEALPGTHPSSAAPSRDVSPVPPLASPISPKLAPARQLAPQSTNVSLIDKPPSLPFSGEDATDAIALRAAISSLQVQRKRAEDDVKTLQRIRDDALARPDDFQKHVVETAMKQMKRPAKFDPHAVQEADDVEVQDTPPQMFPTIPQPQDVVRCPPINWAKYNIVGEPLDRMHNAQQIAEYKPGAGVTAAYDPATDKLEHQQTVGSRGGRKDSGASTGTQSSDLRPFTKSAGSK
ncbi:Chitin synthase 3 [Sphaceloma murrayae]|uniref:Chitin synthase 3 n=1 Tax=Sphaceloma murrayae TaxID=2082308 RepID=A0A2K1QSW8_9PEZI|nr:Chitin synthase 3 [Sphaceloma murrayae]